MPPSPTILAVLLCLLGVTGAAGCRADEPLEVPFLFEHEPSEHHTDDTIPLLLTDWESEPHQDSSKVRVLWPLFMHEREGRQDQTWLLGVPVARHHVDHRGFIDSDYILGPVFYGHSADEGSYLTVMPIGGTMRGLLGKDYALGILFPLFLYMRKDEWKSLHLLFPIFNTWWDGGRSGFRIFPFYAHYERADEEGRLAYRRTWVMWPFWDHLENNLNSTRGKQSMWFLFPFYGRGDGPDTHQFTVLFPFFKYFENHGTGFGGPLWDLRAPWPFVRIVRGRDRRTTDIWPLYGTRERGTELITGPGADYFARRFILWPFWRDEQRDNGRTREDRWWALPFLWSFRTVHRHEDHGRRELKIWPLFRYKEWEDGSAAVNVISPLWFEDPGGAFERIYGPLTRVWHEWRDDEGARRFELLYGLYGERSFGALDRLAVDRTSLLFGLFQYEKRAGERSLRLFFLPPWPRWGTPAVTPPSEPRFERVGTGGQRAPG